MVAYGLEPDFSAAVWEQVKAIGAPPALTKEGSVRDLRSLPWVSIDNDDSCDLDQLSVAEVLSGETVKVLVAVADVGGTVGIASAIDDHAAANTTSVYTPAQIFPMLPEPLSTDLTSLAESKERASLVIELTVDGTGRVIASDIYSARVVNHAKLAYNSVSAWLEGKGPAPARLAAVAGLDGQLRTQDAVAQRLKRMRQARGALHVETMEAQAVLHSGVLSDLRPDEKNRAKELIEHFMIAANEAVAQYLERRGMSSLRRVLRRPERWERIVSLAGELGERLPAEPDAAALNAFLTRRRDADPDRFPDLSLSVVKLLGSAEYVLKRPGEPTAGHFGLALDDYTHSTAPNRRFPDLIAQRLVKAALSGRPAPYSDDDLRTLAEHCTKQERNAAKVERQARKSAAAALLASRIGQRFDAIVTGASEKGTWVRIPDPVAEGRVVKGFEGLDVGDRVRVELTHTDVTRGFIDFTRAR